MPHKTSITLPDDLYATWKRARIPAIEVWRRGLEGTGDTARHTAIEARLAQIEYRVGQLEARAYAPPDLYPELSETDDGPTPEEIQAERAATRRARLGEMHARLWLHIPVIPGQQPTVTAADAAQAWKISDGVARGTMRALAAYGYARQHEHTQGTGRPYVWTVLDPAEVDRTAPQTPATGNL